MASIPRPCLCYLHTFGVIPGRCCWVRWNEGGEKRTLGLILIAMCTEWTWYTYETAALAGRTACAVKRHTTCEPFVASHKSRHLIWLVDA